MVGVVGRETTVDKTLVGAGRVAVTPFKIGTTPVALAVAAAMIGCTTPAGTAATVATVAPTLVMTGVILIVPPEVGATLLRSPRS